MDSMKILAGINREIEDLIENIDKEDCYTCYKLGTISARIDMLLNYDKNNYKSDLHAN